MNYGTIPYDYTIWSLSRGIVRYYLLVYEAVPNVTSVVKSRIRHALTCPDFFETLKTHTEVDISLLPTYIETW